MLVQQKLELLCSRPRFKHMDRRDLLHVAIHVFFTNRVFLHQKVQVANTILHAAVLS